MDWDQCSRPRAPGIRSTASQPGRTTGAVTGQRDNGVRPASLAPVQPRCSTFLKGWNATCPPQRWKSAATSNINFIIVGTKKWTTHMFMLTTHLWWWEWFIMVYCCFNHIKQLSYYKFLHPIWNKNRMLSRWLSAHCLGWSGSHQSQAFCTRL